jgi:uncharacterized protein YjiK
MKKTLRVTGLISKGHDPQARVTEAKVVEKLPLGLPASGIAHLPTGEVLFVHDKKGVYLARAGKKPKRLAKRKGLEGIATDSAGHQVYVVSEGDRSVLRYDVERSAEGEISLRRAGEAKRLPRLKGEKNCGWEGLAFRTSDGGPAQLVCVHEGRPRRIGAYTLPDLAEVWTAALPKDAKRHLPDVADVTVDGRTGHLFLVSDRARTVVELALAPKADGCELVPVSSFRLGLKRSRKPEGLSFDSTGRLWVSLDYEKKDDSRRGVALGIELARGGE